MSTTITVDKAMITAAASYKKEAIEIAEEAAEIYESAKLEAAKPHWAPGAKEFYKSAEAAAKEFYKLAVEDVAKASYKLAEADALTAAAESYRSVAAIAAESILISAKAISKAAELNKKTG